MKATVRQIGSVSVLDLEGKITIGEGDLILRSKVKELLDAGRTSILLNLEQVSYMDSAGIGELVACHKRAKDKGGTIKLLRPSGRVFDSLSIVRLLEIFDNFKDEKEALVSF